MVDTFLRESSKFRILNAPIEAPGTCASCGASSADDRDYIDLGIDLEFFGTIYFCTFCYTEGANALGFVNPDQARELEDKLTAAENHIIEFRTKERALDDTINLLRNSGLLNLNDDPTTRIIEDFNRASDKATSGNNSGSEQIDQHSEQSSSKQRPNDIPTVRSDDPLDSLQL